MIELTVRCSLCGIAKDNPPLEVGNIFKLALPEIVKELEKLGWIIQMNGKHIDTYCSKECAQ